MLQIAMAIMGIIVLVTGKLKLSKNKVVEGTPARLLALILLAPFPVGFVIGLGVGFWAGATGRDFKEIQTALLLVDFGLVIGAAILTFSIGHAIGKPPGQVIHPPAWPDSFAPPTPLPPSDPNNPYQSPRN
jgi:hypothetical protein